MVKKTRKHSKHHTNGIQTIPGLRRFFEHIEVFVDAKIREPRQELIQELCEEWKKITLKDLDKASAEAFIENRIAIKKPSQRTTRRKGGAILSGAPLDYSTRAGIDLAPGQIPNANGSLPLSNGNPSHFGSYTDYVDKGFWNPQPNITYDRVPGQPPWPQIMEGTGSNLVTKGGGRKTRRRLFRKSI
jgi:hypothetical protein